MNQSYPELFGRFGNNFMETPLCTHTERLKKCGILTKKDVLRWKVNACLLETSECMIRSDFFKFAPCPDSKFFLVVFSVDSNTFFTVGLCRIPLEEGEVENNTSIKVSFSLLDIRNRCHHTCDRIFKDEDSIQASFDRSCYTKHNAMFLREGKLIIHCSMDVEEILSEDVTEEKNPMKEKVPFENLDKDLANDLGSLLQHGLHTDVTLNVGEEKFQAHRAILAARSPVFAKMFEHECLEKRENCVLIEDISVDAMKQLLHYLYTGDTDELSTEEFLSLFVAADKYNLPKLKKNCSNSLCTRVTSNIALNVLVVANLHGDDDLKEAAIKKVLENAVEVMKSEEWLTFLREYPEVANGIILNLAMNAIKIKDTKSSSVIKQKS
ncbi:speckle-type POZ protein [Trichonephila clavata]|uniref:Speckle-type POZ protein n=1 Tax=Trichonephila clavata TaxID=2740835 RepID=A0A8X6F9S3_TRICU|nr:speckle-type POZ protein [Trichonephila clavata]